MRKKTIGTIIYLIPAILLPPSVITLIVLLVFLALPFLLFGPFEGLTTSLAYWSIIPILISIAVIPFGYFFMRQVEPEVIAEKKKLDKYKNLTDDQIHYITRWSWSGYYGGVFWGLGNRLWIYALLSIVPVIGVYFWMTLAVDGRRVSWENESVSWASFDQFRTRQKKLIQIFGITTIVAVILLGFFTAIIIKEVKEGLADFEENSEFLDVYRTEEGRETVQVLGEMMDSMDSLDDLEDGLACDEGDADDDMISNIDELRLGTDPSKADTDGDGKDDFIEIVQGDDPGALSGQNQEDTDGDGLFDQIEIYFFKSDYMVADTDADGINDGDEVKAGRAPLIKEIPIRQFVEEYREEFREGLESCE